MNFICDIIIIKYSLYCVDYKRDLTIEKRDM